MIKDWCGTYKLDENKNAIPCSVEEWARQIEEMRKNKTKHVAYESIGHIDISTVWLGLSHQWMPRAKPLIFETMVFNKSGHDIYCERHSTWQEAEEGHKQAIEWVKNGCKDDEIHE